MNEVVARALSQEELLDALAEAEHEMHMAGSCLEMPGNVRFPLQKAAHRAQRPLEAADGQVEA